MACSKIFSGDLPELINEIIQYFRSDFSTLHSCILVNKQWCRLAIPILWEDPLSINTENYNFFDIYLYNLNKDDKMKLNEYGIIIDLFPSNTLFNYPSLIKHLDTWKLVRHITKWATTRTLTEEQSSNYFIQNTNVSSSSPVQIKNASRLIYKALIKIFIENEANLYALEVKIFRDTDLDYFNDVFELILQNSKLTHNIKLLNLFFSKTIASLTNIYSFLKFLYSNCNSISFIKSQFQKDDILIEKHLSQIINSQQNLKGIFFYSNNFPLHHSLLSLKNSNTLKVIIFYNINFKNIVINEVFEQLISLESIHMCFCHSLNSQQIISIARSLKLRTLYIDDKTFQIESYQLLLQKSGDNLENIGFGLLKSNELKQQIYELIIKYCTKVKYLSMVGIDHQNMYLAFDLIKYFGQNINYISIEYIGHHYIPNHNQLNIELMKLSSIIFQELGQILPLKLECLHLYLLFTTSDLEVFLRDSQNTFIKEFVIKMHVGSEDILPYMEEYIMKKKKFFKYFAYMIEDSIGRCRDLFSMKDKVKKFKLYDIVVQDYYNSTRTCSPEIPKYMFHFFVAN